MTVSFVSSTFDSTSAAQAHGNSGTAVAAYGTVTAGNLAIFHASGRAENQTFGTPTNGSWTSITSLSGGDIGLHGVGNVGTNDNAATMLGAWSLILDGTETGNVSVSTSGGAGTNCQINNILQYSTDQAGFDDLEFVTGSDDTHGGSRSVTFDAWNSALQVGDVVVIINSVDTDNAGTISSPTFTQDGTTFGTVSYRARGLNQTGSDNGVHVYEATVESGGTTDALTFTWTTGAAPTTCGPAIAIRIRDVAANPPQTVNLSLVTSTATAQTFTSAKQLAASLITATNTAQVVTGQKVKVAAAQTESSTAQTIESTRQQSVNQLIQMNTAQSITATFTGRANLVTETDSTQVASKGKRKAISLLIQDNFVQSLAGQHQAEIALVEENDEVTDLGSTKFDQLDVILETYNVQPITRQRGYNISQVATTNLAISLGTQYQLLQVVEADSIPAIQRFKRRALAQVTETLTANEITPFHIDYVEQITETQTALPLHIVYTRLVNQVSTTNTANSVNPMHRKTLELLSATNLAQAIAELTKQKLLMLVTGTDIARAIGPKIQHPPSSIILDVIIPDPTQLTVFIEDDEITSGIIAYVSQRA